MRHEIKIDEASLLRLEKISQRVAEPINSLVDFLRRGRLTIVIQTEENDE